MVSWFFHTDSGEIENGYIRRPDEYTTHIRRLSVLDLAKNCILEISAPPQKTLEANLVSLFSLSMEVQNGWKCL